MSSFIPLFIILLFALFPVNFHLHFHRRDLNDYFLIELRLFNFYIWSYRIPRLEMEGVTQIHQRTLESVDRFGAEEKGAQERTEDLDSFLTDLIMVGTALKKYGLGGTFFYFFLPDRYRRWVTVTEKMEKRGRFKRLVWRTVAAGREPAVLGPIVGLLWSAKGVIMGFLANEYVFKQTPRIMVVPCFTGTSWETMLDCIFEIKLGHIIVAGIKDYLIELVGGKKHAGTPD